MSKTKQSGPAFPVPNYVNADGETFESKPQGMFLRDYFAAKAMQGWLSTYGVDVRADDVKTMRVAEFAYEMADAMLTARAL